MEMKGSKIPKHSRVVDFLPNNLLMESFENKNSLCHNTLLANIMLPSRSKPMAALCKSDVIHALYEQGV
jgi:hypothetical protein